MSARAPAARELLRRAAVVAPTALARRLSPGPPRPTALAHCFDDREGFLAFERLAATVFHKDYRRIMEPPAAERGEGLAFARMRALVACVERDYCPCEEPWDPEASYGAFMAAIPFAHRSWGDDELHFLDGATDADDLLLIAALAPFVREEIGDALFDLAAEHAGRPALARLARITVADEAEWGRQWRDHPRYGALVWMLRWLRGDTGVAQLDFSPERYENDLAWSREHLRWLRDEHARAQAILDRIGELAAWLREDPAAHLDELIQVVYGEEIGTLGHEGTTTRPDEASASDDRGAARPGPDQLALPVGAAAG